MTGRCQGGVGARYFAFERSSASAIWDFIATSISAFRCAAASPCAVISAGVYPCGSRAVGGGNGPEVFTSKGSNGGAPGSMPCSGCTFVVACGGVVGIPPAGETLNQ